MVVAWPSLHDRNERGRSVRDEFDAWAMVEKLGPWFMRHEVSPGRYTPVAESCAAFRQPEYDLERSKLFMTFIDAAVGIGGQSVVDIGCGSGYFLLEAMRRGAATGLGMDARGLHVRQGRYLAEIYGCAGCRFEERCIEDIVGAPPSGDVILFLDVLQYLLDPFSTLRALRRATGRILLLDTYVRGAPSGNMEALGDAAQCNRCIYVEFNDRVVHQKHGIHGWVLVPTMAAILDMLRYAGFGLVARLRPPADWAHPRLPLGRYCKGERCVLGCFPEAVDLPAVARAMCDVVGGTAVQFRESAPSMGDCEIGAKARDDRNKCGCQRLIGRVLRFVGGHLKRLGETGRFGS